MAIAAGADAVGLVGRMPSGPGPIPDATILEIAAAVPPPTATFLLTSEVTPSAVVAHVKRTAVNTVQLVDEDVDTGVYDALRDALPSVRIVQVIHVQDNASIERAFAVAGRVDALLLDSGNPSAAVRELGGTGRVHDWSISRSIVEHVDVPVFLAGGLTAANVGEAVRGVQPFGVDLCSGVRTNGKLDHQKVRSFTNALAQATSVPLSDEDDRD